MTLSVGDRLPQATFSTMTAEGPAPMTTADVFAGRKVVAFALPGAFTPTCHAKHVPGFLARADDFRAKGVDCIACISVNDVFVMDAWARTLKAGNRILFLADGNAEFTKAAGLDYDASKFGMGVRSKRYAMIVEDGVVTALEIETARGEATVSGGEHMLGLL